ncbi:hypothetical protein AAVH_32230, partial [Aphelenchoides avenae]
YYARWFVCWVPFCALWVRWRTPCSQSFLSLRTASLHFIGHWRSVKESPAIASNCHLPPRHISREMSLGIFLIAALAVMIPLLSVTTCTEAQTSFTEAESATQKIDVAYDALNVSRLEEIAEDARSIFGNTNATNLFVNNPTVGDYFDNIAEAAAFLEVALKARTQGIFTDKFFDITAAIDAMFKDASAKADDQAAPLGLRECRLLPAQLNNFT